MIISFGHDKCIFNVNAFSSSCWIGPDGENPIRPKGGGLGRMYSSLHSRKFGFGFPQIPTMFLQKIKKAREGKNTLT